MKRIAAAVVCAVLLSSCGAFDKKPTPDFDPASPQTQAAYYISGKKVATGKKVFIPAFSLGFALKSAASAQTKSFGSGNIDARSTQMYYLQGINDEQLQALTDKIYADTVAKFKAAGYEVLTKDDLASDPAFQKYLEKGVKGDVIKYSAAGSDYKVFAPKGLPHLDARFKGTMGALASIKFKPTEMPNFYLGKIGVERGVDLFVFVGLVNFANFQTSGGWGASKAEVKADVKFVVMPGVSSITYYPSNKMKSYAMAFTTDKFNDINAANNTFGLKEPVISSDKIYTDIKDVTSTGFKAAEVVGNILGMMGGGITAKTRAYNVTVDPAGFESASRKSMGGYVDMVMSMLQKS